MDDSKIIELFFECSEQAIMELSNKYGTICNKVAVNILKNRLDAEECINDAYLGVWNSIPPQRPDPLLTYICKIVRNLSVKRYHSNTAEKRNSFYDVALDELEECIPSNFSVEDELLANQLSWYIDDFLDSLEQENRVMFVRRYWYADSVSDIAAMFHMSSRNVTMRLLRIRERLRKFLEKEGLIV